MEFKEYELSFDKYQNSLSVKQFPLISWDFYLSFFDYLTFTFPDIRNLNKIAEENDWNIHWNFQQELSNDTVIVVTDDQLKIVFASKNIEEMNGYKPNEVIGKTPKMFQGKLTNPDTSKEISTAIKKRQSFNKTITNYRKDGSLYKCHIKGYPIFDKAGQLINFIAFEKIAA